MPNEHYYDVLSRTYHFGKDPSELTADFKKRYNCEITQSRKRMVELRTIGFPARYVDDCSTPSVESIPCVDISMANTQLETLVVDLHRYEAMQRFFNITPEMMEKFEKFLIWEKLKS